MCSFSSPRLRAAALTAALLAVLPATPAAAAPQISSTPTLQPAFDPAISDYVTRCTGDPVELSVDAPSDTSVAIDGDGPRSGAFTRPVALGDGQAFSFALAGETTGSYHVRCLPADYPPYSAQRTGTPQARFYAVTASAAFGPAPSGVSQGFVALYDNGGAPLWWYESPTPPIDAKLLSNGHLVWSNFGPLGGSQERRFDGSLVRTLNTVGHASDIHEIELLPNGNYRLPIYRPLEHVDLSAIGMPSDATIIDAVVQELTPAGALVSEWRASEHIAPSQVPPRWWSTIYAGGIAPNSPGHDIYHLNSIERDGDGMVISFRVLDAVYRFDGAGAVDWKLGGSDLPGTSLAVSGDPVLAPPSPDPGGPLAGQHDARILPDGDVTIHENGADFGGATVGGRRPRAVRYTIDAAAKTATFVEQSTDPDVAQSLCCGSARKLPGGNWVVGWGGRQKVSETTPGGTRVFNLDFAAPIFSYRTQPILATQLSARTLRSGMDEQFPRPALSIGGDATDFGEVTVVTAAALRRFTVTNSGSGAVSISAVTLGGADAAAFELMGDDCAGETLAADTSCEVRVGFVASALGEATATLRIASDAASGPNEAILTGTGIAAVVIPPPDDGGTETPTGPSTNPPAADPPAITPSSAFVVQTVKSGSTGTVRLLVRLPGAGALRSRATVRRGGASVNTTLASRLTTTANGGTVRVVLSLNRTGRRLLRERGRLRVRLALRFNPSAGSPRSQARTLTLRAR